MGQDNLFKKTEYALYNYRDLDIKIKSIEIDIDMLQNDITLKAINYDEKSGPTNAFNSSVENEIIRREEVVREQIHRLQKDKLLYAARKNKIQNALMCLTKEELKLVELRYFSKPKQGWVRIGTELCLDKDYCCTLKNKIVKKLSGYMFN